MLFSHRQVCQPSVFVYASRYANVCQGLSSELILKILLVLVLFSSSRQFWVEMSGEARLGHSLASRFPCDA
jgi:hypothetical protein